MKELSVQLTDKQVKLVDTLVATGCSIKEAAGTAGYAKGESGRVSASKALRTPKGTSLYADSNTADSWTKCYVYGSA